METLKPTLEIGKKFLSFWVIRLIGRGGIGEVYEIKYKGEPQALKVIQAKWLGEESLVRRTVDEGELLVGIKHPNVVGVHETGVTPEGQVWIRMELLVGETLREVMSRRELISVALACTYMRSVGHAAHQCHVIGAVHRDIKPENLFITNPDENVKLLDFGIAKLYGSPDTADGQRHGTPLYMAPEQIRGHRVTPATDVYALGLVAYELLCGANPFVDDPRAYDLYALYYKHFSEIPAPLTSIGIPKEISDVVAKALAKDPRERHQSGHEFAEALWGAWCIVREREPDWDTEPGEPTRQELMQRPVDGLSFGTGPSEGRRPSAPADARPSRTSRPSRISLVHRAVESAKAEPLPMVPREPEALVAFLLERSSNVPPAPPTEPTEPQGQERRTSPAGTSLRLCAPAAPSVRLAPVVEFGARARFVPVQTTVPLSAVRAEAAVPVRVEVAAPAPVPLPAPEPAPEPPRPFTAATVPYPAPPRVEASNSGVHAQPEAKREARTPAPRPGTRAWAEVSDPAEAGIHPVPGIDLRVVNPRRVGTFAAPDPLVLAARKADGRREGRPLSFRADHLVGLVAVVSVALAGLFFLVLHVTRARRESAPAPASDATAQPTALPSASAPETPASSAAPAFPTVPAATPPLERTRTASLPTALPTLRPQAPPANTTKKARPNGDVVDPWAR